MKRSFFSGETVSIANLKARLAYYLRKVRAGEEVVITEHKRPVAKIVQLEPADGLAVIRPKGSFADVAGKNFEPLKELPTVDSLSELLKERGDR